MLTVHAQLLGVLAFVVATLLIGRGIRRSPTQEAAQRLSRVSHALFWGAMVAPEYFEELELSARYGPAYDE